jgi:hypothetical protein
LIDLIKKKVPRPAKTGILDSHSKNLLKEELRPR